MAVTVLGFMAFQAAAFYLAYFMQEIRQWTAIIIAVHLLPQALAGLLWNVIIGNILHRVNNTILMAAGALSYFAACLLLSLMSADSNYWAFMFPSLVLNVVGADFQFNVANVSCGITLFLYIYIYIYISAPKGCKKEIPLISSCPRCTSCRPSRAKPKGSPAAS